MLAQSWKARRAELLSKSLHFSEGNDRFHNVSVASEMAQDGQSQVRMQREIHRSCGERDDVWFKNCQARRGTGLLGDLMQKVVRRQPEELRHNNEEKTNVVLIPRRS
jgi:hypothetical protein